MASIYLNMLELLNNCYDMSQLAPVSLTFIDFQRVQWSKRSTSDWRFEWEVELNQVMEDIDKSTGYISFCSVFFGCQCCGYTMLQQNLAGNSTCLLAGISEERSPPELKKTSVFLSWQIESTSTLICTMPESRWIWKEELWFICQGGCFTCPLVSGKWYSSSFHRKNFLETSGVTSAQDASTRCTPATASMALFKYSCIGIAEDAAHPVIFRREAWVKAAALARPWACGAGPVKMPISEGLDNSFLMCSNPRFSWVSASRSARCPPYMLVRARTASSGHDELPTHTMNS